MGIKYSHAPFCIALLFSFRNEFGGVVSDLRYIVWMCPELGLFQSFSLEPINVCNLTLRTGVVVIVLGHSTPPNLSSTNFVARRTSISVSLDCISSAIVNACADFSSLGAVTAYSSAKLSTSKSFVGLFIVCLPKRAVPPDNYSFSSFISCSMSLYSSYSRIRNSISFHYGFSL